MVTESVKSIFDLEQSETSAKAELAALNEERQSKAQAAMSSGDFNLVMAIGVEYADKVKAAEAKVATATKAVADFKAADAWERMVTIRQPIVDTASELISNGKLAARVSEAHAVISIADVEITDAEGVKRVKQPKVTLSYKLEGVDTTGIEALLLDSFNMDAFMAEGVNAVQIDCTGLLTDSPLTTVKRYTGDIKESSATASGATGITRTTYEVFYGGEWITSRAYKAKVNPDAAETGYELAKAAGLDIREAKRS